MASGGAVVGGGDGARAGEESSGGGAPEPSAGQEPSAPAAPAREPIGEPAVIDYPELAPEELTASPVFREALEKPSVILYNDRPLTNPQPVIDFLAAVAEKKDWDLFVYTFNRYDDSASVFLTHFISSNGEVVKKEGYESGWQSISETENSYAVHPSMALNDYGYLTYRDAYSEYAFQVVSDLALYEDGAERQRLYDTYLAPIFYTALGNGSWTSAREAGHLIWLFEDIYNYENEDSVWERFGDTLPVDVMVETLSRYFDGVTADDLISSRRLGGDAYDPQTNTIHYEGGRGGGPKCLRVTGYAQEGDRLAIDYEQYDPSTGLPFEGTSRLTVRLLEDGGFRYLSNQEG